MARIRKLFVTAVVAAAALPLSGCEEATFCGVPVLSFLFCDPTANSTAPATFETNDDPVASFSVDPAAPGVGVRVTFSNTSHDPDGVLPGLQGINSAEWDLDGDGTFETRGNPKWTNRGYRDDVTHTYTASGPVTVGLRVMDWESAQATITRTINVGGTTSTPTGQTSPPGKPKVHATGATPAHGFLARMALGDISAAGARRTSRSLRGVRVRARLSGSTVAVRGRGTVGLSRPPPVLDRFLGSPVVARVDITTNSSRTLQRMTAVGLATLRGQPRGQVCFTLRLTNRPGRLPAGSIRMLGGTGAGATLFGSGRVSGGLRKAQIARIGGTLRTRSGRSRGLPARCRGLTP